MLPFKNGNFSNIAIVGRAITLERELRTDTKKEAKSIKSENFTMGNIEKSIMVSYFDGSNNIFADCKYTLYNGHIYIIIIKWYQEQLYLQRNV